MRGQTFCMGSTPRCPETPCSPCDRTDQFVLADSIEYSLYSQSQLIVGGMERDLGPCICVCVYECVYRLMGHIVCTCTHVIV